MRYLIILILFVSLTGCYLFDPIETYDMDGNKITQLRAERIAEQSAKYTERLPFPWGWIATAGIGIFGIGARVAYNIRKKK